MYSDPEDIRTHIKGIREIQKLLHTPSMQKVNARLKVNIDINPISPAEPIDICFETTNYDSDEFWACVLRRRVYPTHPVSSCPIGRKGDMKSVVDQYLRVHDIKGLRVADASIMPEVPSANIMGPSIMVGERAADFIRKGYLNG